MVHDPWDGVKPRPSTFTYLARRATTTLDRAISVRYLWSNYYHFFFDTLPQIRLLDALGVARDVPVLVPEYVTRVPFVRDFFELSNFLQGRELLVQKRGDYTKVASHTFVAKDTYCPPAIFDVLSSLGSHLGDAAGDLRVFIRRDPGGPRALSNDAEIGDIAERHGFMIVDPATMTLREQITLFKRARVVVGGHGAGLTNIIFRNRRPLRLLELFPSDLTPDFYRGICIQFGYAYDRLLGSALDERKHFHVDAQAFEAALRRCDDDIRSQG